MTSRDKLRALVIIWAAFIIACMVTFIGRPSIGFGEAALGFFYVICTTGVSIAITESKLGIEPDTQAVAAQEKSKMKREDTSLIDRMVESMDDEERAALFRRLGGSDGTRNELMMTDDGELKQRR